MLTEDVAGAVSQGPLHAPAAECLGRPGANRRQRRRIRFLVAGLLVVAAIGYMIYSAMQSGSEYFVTVSELTAMGDRALGQPTRLGGRVVESSVQWDRGAATVTFVLADEKQTLPVSFKGVVPDSFQPGTDVILDGTLGTDGQFRATGMMAKCASKYEPARR